MMKRYKWCVLWIFIATELFGCGKFAGAAETAGAAATRENNGSIMLYQKIENGLGSGKSCLLAVPKEGESKDYKLSDNKCDNDVYSFIRIDNVPSTVQIRMGSEGDCNVRPDWAFDLLVYINPTSSAILSIPELKGHAAGDIITKGIRLKDEYYSHGNIEGKLSCVQICGPGASCDWKNW